MENFVTIKGAYGQKAKELIGRMMSVSNYMIESEAKKCALIVVEQILKENKANFHHDGYPYEETKNYEEWQKVREEIISG